MRTIFYPTIALAALATSLAAAPALTGVVNPASNIPPGLPNYGIAQGSIFVVYGSSLGPANLIQASALPLPTTAGLGGTVVTVTVNGTTVTAPMIYSYQSQVAAVLPSNTPLGTGSISVSFNGAVGTSPITVVTSAFGISTVNQSGAGSAVVTYPNYSLATSTNSAKPGDTVVIWGTGLGPISGSDAIDPTPVDLGTPIQVYVGGVQATVTYRGRSGSPGLDQINIVIPQGIQPGCGVSLVVQTGNMVSNTTSMPLAPGGGTCSDPVVTGTPTPPTGATSYKYGVISLASTSVTLTIDGKTTTTSDAAALAEFEQINIAASSGGTTSSGTTSTTITSEGSCSVVSTLTPVSSASGGGSTGTSGVTSIGLDAGASITVTPPTGSAIALTRFIPGAYDATVSNLATISAGTWQFSNGAGGADIGPFTLNVAMGTPLVWTNQSITMTTIDRTQPLTFTWTGGDPSQTAEIVLVTETLNTAASTLALAEVVCSAPVAAGQFTVPSYVLLGLIPNAGTSLAGFSSAAAKTVSIPGLDTAYVSVSTVTEISTTFK